MSPRRSETHEEYLARRRQQNKCPERKAKAAERMRGYRLKNHDKIRALNKRNYAKNGGGRSKYKRTYGITPAQYDEMLSQQRGLCASCGGTGRPGRPLCVDHCHKTKAIRGLLCDSCNICAGHIESHRYEKVKAYLARQNKPYDPVADSLGSYDTALEALRNR